MLRKDKLIKEIKKIIPSINYFKSNNRVIRQKTSTATQIYFAKTVVKPLVPLLLIVKRLYVESFDRFIVINPPVLYL